MALAARSEVMISNLEAPKMKKCFAFVAVVLASFAAHAGCGGDDNATGPTTPGDGGGADATTAPDGSPADDASGAADTATASDTGTGGSFTDAPPTATTDGGGSNDAGPGGNTSTITCGSASCSLAGSFCCVYNNKNPPPEFVFGCATGSGCPTRAGAKSPIALACSSAANCPASTVCCLKDDGNTIRSECAATCVDSSNVTTAQLCDPSAATTGCPSSDPCSSDNINDWKLPNGFATCGGKSN
jgi:hypothetical protein